MPALGFGSPPNIVREFVPISRWAETIPGRVRLSVQETNRNRP